MRSRESVVAAGLMASASRYGRESAGCLARRGEGTRSSRGDVRNVVRERSGSPDGQRKDNECRDRCSRSSFSLAFTSAVRAGSRGRSPVRCVWVDRRDCRLADLGDDEPWFELAVSDCRWLSCLAALWFSYRLVNIPQFADFLIAVEAEMNKVSWPSRGELIRSSVVVIFVIFLLAVVLFGYDLIWRQLFACIGVRLAASAGSARVLIGDLFRSLRSSAVEDVRCRSDPESRDEIPSGRQSS